MKKLVSSITFLLIVTLGLHVYAFEIPGYEGGIQNEVTYQEVIFVTGEPILMEGTLTIRGDRYTYRLENIEKEAELSRNVTFAVDAKANGNQSTETASIRRFSETIEVAGVEYEVDDNNYQWSKAKVYQNKPGVSYFAGNWDGLKTYTINDGEGRVVVKTRGDVVGYDHNWGTTQTQSISHFIEYERNVATDAGEETLRWQGTVEVDVVHNRTKDYSYEPNAPTQISFRGGYNLIERQENILKVSYDLPRLNEEGLLSPGRNLGTESKSLETTPVNQRLEIPVMRDILGHWAERDIFFLASLSAINPNNTNFGPSLPMSRGDFARGIVESMGIESESRTRIASRQNNSNFIDVTLEDPNQKYIDIVYEKGIMQGTGKGLFSPNTPLTKAQAATILVRTLGFENLAPIQNYSTGFRDDAQIPHWAKDSVYVAKELGLVSGTPDGYFQPNKELTKAEAATMLTNFINYLQRDLRFDYRENILNF